MVDVALATGELPPAVDGMVPNPLCAKHLRGKQTECAAAMGKTKPLNLLDLPIDVLQTVLKEVTHTNDLSSLALTHSALHDLVIPHIYSRFDIVWPDANATSESRIGVDALTYGLATLVMARDVFGEATHQQQSLHKCQTCGHHNINTQPSARHVKPHKIRRGNYFAQYTRKFSLGNGPVDWVQEYLITKEAGKMLGTLVALAIGRMLNLEAFIWDMPTGILRDVWLALASLWDRKNGEVCRLERVWVRWHDNQEQRPLVSPALQGSSPGQAASNIPTLLSGSTASLFQIPPYPRVEYPTFSILPPLRSLSVLDIDELPYAEELSVLLARSLDRLRELRIGIAQHAQFDVWVRPAEDRTLVPPPFMSTSDQIPRPGGMLGILTSRFCDPFGGAPNALVRPTHETSTLEGAVIGQSDPAVEEDVDAIKEQENNKDYGRAHDISALEINQLGVLLSTHNLDDDSHTENAPVCTVPNQNPAFTRGPYSLALSVSADTFQDVGKDDRQSQKLELDVLEMERIYLSISVLSRALDWSRLTSLTLLGCRNHEQLWKALRKKFTPQSRGRTPSSSSKPSTAFGGMFPHLHSAATPTSSPAPDSYVLKLSKLHTDTVSPSLIAFIKDTLAPDTLESLFLQESTAYKSPVTIDQIYKGAIRRHRGSLKKLLIDSELRTDDEAPDTNWRRWVYHRELLSCITSGRMQLRELSMSIDYKDWHFFLQRLPYATALRSLHISHIAEHVHARVDSREAALQVLDIVSLRPELELCYLGIQAKCFEVLQYKDRKSAVPLDSFPSNAVVSQTVHVESDDNSDANEGADDDDDSDFEVASSDGGAETDDDGRPDGQQPVFKLREILFYDDKVSIFKARHGKL